MLTSEGCRARQARLLAAMEANGYDLLLTGNYRTAYYFTGSLTAAEAPVIFAIASNGDSLLVTPSKHAAVAGEVRELETYSIRRTIEQPWRDAAALLDDWLVRRQSASSIAVERAATPHMLCTDPAAHDATRLLLRLRKRKEEDEIAEIRQALHYCAVAYDAARQAIAPRRTELDVYNAMYSAIVRDAGSSIVFAGDFACGARGIREGGPPTRREILPGDLYILDIFPAPALYFGDTCRTFSVGAPSDRQFRAWEIVRDAVPLGESLVRPGVRARDVYAAVKDFLDGFPLTEGSFWHHAGHGIGHHGHEAPRIIPGTDDVFEVGDVITLEPGVYAEALQGGIRLEDNYVVREHGLENLFAYPMELY